MKLTSCVVMSAAFCLVAHAYPGNYQCNTATCMAGKTKGGSFGGMGVANFANTYDNCKITHNIPAGGFKAGQSYTITVTSTTALAQKVVTDNTGFGGSAVKNGGSKVTSGTHTWTAPSQMSAKFYAVCARGGGNSAEANLAQAVTVTLDGTTAQPTTTTAAPTTTTTKGPSTTTKATTKAATTTTAKTTAKGTTSRAGTKSVSSAACIGISSAVLLMVGSLVSA